MGWRTRSVNRVRMEDPIRRSSDGQQLEPGNRVRIGVSRLDTSVGEATDSGKAIDGRAGLERGRRHPGELQLRRRIVPVSAIVRTAIRPQNALLFQVAGHARREANLRG